MQFKYLNSVLLSMFLLTLLSAEIGGVSAQNNVDSPPSAEQGVQPPTENQPIQGASSTVVQESQFKGWFNRTGAGLFISLTPFATAVTVGVILLILLISIWAGARNQKRARGYFETIPHSR